MKKIIYKVIIIILGLVLIDFAIGLIHGWLSDKLNEDCRIGKAARLNYSINEVHTEMFIIGSSYVYSGYVPQVFEDSIYCTTGKKWKAFDVACPNQRIKFSEIALLSAIERGDVPKFVILDIGDKWLSDSIIDAHMAVLHPYYGKNRFVTDFIDTYDTKENKILLHCNMWRCRDNFINLIIQFGKSGGSDGFEINTNELSDDEATLEATVDTNSVIAYNVDALTNIIKVAKNNGIKIVIVNSPKFTYVDKYCKSYRKIVEVCHENGVTFIDNGNNPIFMHGEYFRDNGHLNAKGAYLHSAYLWGQIKDEITGQKQ